MHRGHFPARRARKQKPSRSSTLTGRRREQLEFEGDHVSENEGQNPREQRREEKRVPEPIPIDSPPVTAGHTRDKAGLALRRLSSKKETELKP